MTPEMHRFLMLYFSGSWNKLHTDWKTRKTTGGWKVKGKRLQRTKNLGSPVIGNPRISKLERLYMAPGPTPHLTDSKVEYQQ